MTLMSVSSNDFPIWNAKGVYLFIHHILSGRPLQFEVQGPT